VVVSWQKKQKWKWTVRSLRTEAKSENEEHNWAKCSSVRQKMLQRIDRQNIAREMPEHRSKQLERDKTTPYKTK
jgi:hypothetical protein